MQQCTAWHGGVHGQGAGGQGIARPGPEGGVACALSAAHRLPADTPCACAAVGRTATPCRAGAHAMPRDTASAALRRCECWCGQHRSSAAGAGCRERMSARRCVTHLHKQTNKQAALLDVTLTPSRRSPGACARRACEASVTSARAAMRRRPQVPRGLWDGPERLLARLGHYLPT